MMHRAFARGLVLSPLLAGALSVAAPAQDLLPELEPPAESGAEPSLEFPPAEPPFDEPTDLAVPQGQQETSDMDALFAALADPANPDWQKTQDEIWRRWSRSGSASMDLLLKRADDAAGAGDLDGALRFLNDLVRLAPDFAEGWNKRATLYFMRDEYGRSVADIERTLALEPRHFGALSGLAIILEETGRDADALRAWRRAAEINPNLEPAAEAIERLSPEVDGRRL